MIGELHASFRFVDGRLAAALWRRVNAACGYVSVFRWRVDQADPAGPQAVSVVAERSLEQVFDRAVALLEGKGGVRFEPDAWVLDALRARRARVAQLAGGREARTVIRSPGGHLINQAGETLGPRGAQE